MKKVLSLLLAVMMVISLCPITALADEVNPIELQQVEAQGEQQEAAAPLAETAGQSKDPNNLLAGTIFKIDGEYEVVSYTRNDHYNAPMILVRVPTNATEIKINVDAKYEALTDYDYQKSYGGFKAADEYHTWTFEGKAKIYDVEKNLWVNANYRGYDLYIASFTDADMENNVGDIVFFKSDEVVNSGGGEQPEQPTKPSTGKNNGIFTVQLEDGTEVYPEELAKPESITWGGRTYPASAFDNYVDGIWKVTVPASADKLKFSLDNLKGLAGGKSAEMYAFFGDWQGGMSANGTSAFIDSYGCGPDEKFYGKSTLVDKYGDDYSEFMYDTEYKDGFYTIPFEYLMRDPAKMTDVEKQVWGELDPQYKYAVVYIGTFTNYENTNTNMAFDAMVLVQIGGVKEKPKNNGIFTVQLEDGTEVYPQELHGAATIDPDDEGTNYKLDYVDGFWRVIVPEGTTALKISLDNLKNTAGEKAEPYAFFALDTGGSQYISGNADSYEFDPTFIKRDGKYCFYGNISYEGSEANIERQLETKYENGFYTIPLEDFASSAEYVQEDAEWYSYLSDFEGAKVNTDYKYASIFVGTFTKGKMANGYDCKILVQIGGVKEKPKNNGIFTVQLEDGTEVYPEKLSIPETFEYKGSTYTFDDKDGHWKIVVPEGTKNIKVKLDNLSITEGLVIDEHCHIGAHGMSQGSKPAGAVNSTYLLTAGAPFYSTQTALDNRVASYKDDDFMWDFLGKPIVDATVVDAYNDGWFTLPLDQFTYPNSNADWMNPYGELDSKYQWAEITIGFVDPAGTTSNAEYQAMILVQIGGVKEKPKNNGIFTVQLEDGTEVYPEKLAIPETFERKGSTYTFDDKDGHWKIIVPEGTKNIKVKLDNLSITEGLVLDEHCHIGAHGRGQGVSSGGVQEYKFSVIKPVYCTQTALDNRLTTVKREKQKQAIRDASVVDAYEDGWFTLPLESFIYNDNDWMKPYGELDSKYQWAEIIIGFVDLASTSNAKSNPWYQAAILVQIGGDGESGENTPPVRRSNVAASISMSTDNNLKCEIDLSDVFYDADGDALTYKVRLGTDGEYVPFEGSTYTHTLTDWNGETLYFTANDGKTDGGSYIVKLNISRDVLIAICEAIIDDPSDYWTENDNWDGTTYTVSGRYKTFVDGLKGYKTAGSSESYYKDKLIAAYKNLMPKSKVNASSLYSEAVHNRIKDTSVYTDVSVPPYLEALAAVDALYAEGAIANEPYTEEKQAEIERVAAECLAAKKNLVWKGSYKKAFEYYQKNKDEAKKLLELYDPAKYTERDYTAESWQAFVGAWNDLKADVDFVFDEESGSPREYQMLQNFEAHMKALPQKFSELVSAIDITVSFKYIENMHFRYEVKTAGTDGYYNAAMTLKAGETTVMDAVNISGRTLYTFTSGAAQVKEGMTQYDMSLMGSPLYALFINGVYVNTGRMGNSGYDADISAYQLHNGDEVVVARITAQFTGGEVSTGYDTTQWNYSAVSKPEGIENSVGLISINSITQNAKVGDSVTIKASAKTAHASNLGKKLNAEGLTLLISEPSEENVVSQNWQKTVFTTNAKGTIDYVFAEPGYYTVAIVNNKYDEPTLTNVYGVTTVGTYNTLMIGDFTTVYIAPADDPDALVAEWREKNLAEAKAYFEQFRYYDFDNGVYEDTLVPMYKALVENQKNAKTFKELVNSYNSDFSELQEAVNKNLRNHEAMVEELRSYLRYIPADLSEINYSYSYIVGEIQRIYGGMNDYEKNLLSDKERELAEKLMLLDANNLPTGKNVTIDVQKDENMVLARGYGWLPSAPNENKVYKVLVSYGISEKYYKWTTGTASEPFDDGMTAYPGDIVHARRLVATSDDAYWMVFSYDGGNTWKLSTKVDGGEGMFSADFTMPETDADTLVFALKMVSKAEYEKMKLNAETPEMALEEAQAAYKAALEEAFAAYDKDRYTAENYTTIRYAKEDGITNINKAKTVTAVVNYFNIALEAMKAVPQKAQVYVEVKNETFTESYVDDDGNTIAPPWTGTLVSGWVNIDEDSTMMSCVVDILATVGYEAVGAEKNYISSIRKIGEKEGLGERDGGSGSGWMGTLNDWFTNLGFGEFSVANGTLKAGDRISVMYTCTLGSDIGGAVEGNTDTSLKALSATNGTLAPAFDKETTSYLLTMDEGKHTVTLNYTANNKAFQVRTYLNRYTPSSDDYYACGETISVKEGDIIYVSCGDPAWPSMAGNDAMKIIPHVYEITVVGSTGAVAELIKALPAPEKLVYSDKDDVDNAKRLFDALSDEKKAEISEELQDKLEKCVARMAGLEKVHAVEELIAALPAKRPLTEEQEAKLAEAKEAFDALGDLQKDVKNVYINKLLSLLGQQMIYFDYQGGKEGTKMLFTQKDGKLALLPETSKDNFHFDGWYTEKDGGKEVTLDTIFTEGCKLYAHWLNDVQYVEKLINAIGEVELTDECKERIDAARAAVDALSEEDKVNVSNYEVLLDAEAKYAELVAKREADKAAAKAVDEKVAAIGNVELSDESKAKIDEARKAFDALTPEQKKFLDPETESKLVAAEKEYARLVKEAEDKAAAKAVDEKVVAIGNVELSDESKAKIDEARKAFDALTPEQKKFLDPETEGKLVAAENEYKKLVKDDADKKAAKEVEEKIASIGTVTKNSGTAIKDARSSYEALTPEQKDLVSKEALKALEEAEKAFARISRINEDSEPIHIIASKGDNKGEKNPNTGAPAMSIAPAMLVLAAAAFVLKKRG